AARDKDAHSCAPAPERPGTLGDRRPTARSNLIEERDMQGCDEVFLTRLSLSIGVDPRLEIAPKLTAEENQRLVERVRRLVILSADAPARAAVVGRPGLPAAPP